jgi:hypothetical protein
MTVNISLCGAVPRSVLTSSPAPSSREDGRGAQPLRDWMTSGHKQPKESVCTKESATSVGTKQICEFTDRSTLSIVSSDRSLSSLLNTVSQSEDSDDNTMPAFSNQQARLQSLTMVEPPRWAVPAKGESRLEVSVLFASTHHVFAVAAIFSRPSLLQPVCEALGTHQAVDLTSRSCFRIGRSPASDVQLVHGTSSRRHALLFHHPNGSCYLVDCGSAHGTYVNGVRVRSTPSAGMVVPHRVRRGALVRFGGPGAPSFVLKSFTVGFSHMLKDLEQPSCHPTLSPTSASLQVQLNTRINAVGAVHCGILKKRSIDEGSDDEGQSAKRRCISPLLQSPESPPLRLVSPDPSTRRVTFNDVPERFYPSLVSPDLSSDDVSLD